MVGAEGAELATESGTTGTEELLPFIFKWLNLA
jgi:hypothetical protein